MMAPPAVSAGNSRYNILGDLILLAAANLGVYFIVKYALSRFDPGENVDDKRRKAVAEAALKRLDHREISQAHEGQLDTRRIRPQDLDLNQYEQAIAAELIAPEDIAVNFQDIGGLDNVIDELRESVIYPLTMPHLYAHSSSLLSAPSGVLLHGPPGCGKTMLAKALARESGATFINLHISTLTDKWFGDSNKLVSAVFSLARKFQPTIVFIDEIDAVLGQRRSGEHEASAMVKAEFMTHWDGLTSANIHGEPQRIMILGATNRMKAIDEAILRRMPKKFEVSLPSPPQRLRILGLVLKDTKVDKENFDLEYLVRATQGMSGSDLKEACRDAAMVPVREHIRAQKASGTPMTTVAAKDIRGLRTSDFFGAAGGHARLAKAPSSAYRSGAKEVRAEQSDEYETETEDP